MTRPDIEGFDVTGFSALKTDKFGLDVCDVNVYITHGDVNDTVRIQTLLPVDGSYNGRFRAVGGGGIDAGWFEDRLAENIEDGYVVAATDAGLDPSVEYTVGPLAQQLLMNFAYLSIHEMTLIGKALAEQLYGEPVSYSYFTGCSQGGRQGLIAAQRYPEDFDGVLAAAPVADWPRFNTASLWPYLVQVRETTFPDACVWDSITDRAIDACDADDGGEDGIISDPFNCDFDPASMVGETVCGNVTITDTIAKLWNEVTAGPTNPDASRAWFGLPPGSNLTNVASEGFFWYTSSWTANFVEQFEDFDENTIPADELYLHIEKSARVFGQLFMTDKIDLNRFRGAGGKLLSWHGLADETVPPQVAIQYRERALSALNEDAAGDAFFRFFTAPGVRHCRGGQGAVPTRPLQQLVEWVEEEKAPERLEASGVVGDRKLCLWPEMLTYRGEGDLAEASSWTCT
jgi:pimeloyl-ACP methyl ester carboxylesterase